MSRYSTSRQSKGFQRLLFRNTFKMERMGESPPFFRRSYVSNLITFGVGSKDISTQTESRCDEQNCHLGGSINPNQLEQIYLNFSSGRDPSVDLHRWLKGRRRRKVGFCWRRSVIDSVGVRYSVCIHVLISDDFLRKHSESRFYSLDMTNQICLIRSWWLYLDFSSQLFRIISSKDQRRLSVLVSNHYMDWKTNNREHTLIIGFYNFSFIIRNK